MPHENKLPGSGQLFFLQNFAASRVETGEINLFLVRLTADGRPGGRLFLTTLRPGQEFFPQEPLTLSEQIWQLAGVTLGAVTLSPATGQEGVWLETLTRAAEEYAGKQLSAATVSELLTQLPPIWQEKREQGRTLNHRNRELTAQNLHGELQTLGSLAGIEVPSGGVNQKRDLLALALKDLARIYHLPLKLEAGGLLPTGAAYESALLEFGELAGWRIRRIELPQDYWHQAATPVLAFRRDRGTPAILYLKAHGSYSCDYALGKQKIPLTRQNAADYQSRAYCFYEPFPAEKLTKKVIFNFIFAQAKPIFWLILAVGLLSSAIGFVMPVATQYVTGKIIPTANVPELGQLLGLLVVLTVGEIVLGVVPALIMMLFSAHQYERFQAAVYHHILRIPVNVFRRCDSGDMTTRILGASQIQQTVFGIISGQFSNSLFSLVSLLMMFYYSVPLATVGLGMVLLYAGGFFLLSKINLLPLARHTAAAGRLSGLMKQFFDGMAKIRGAGAEQRVLVRFMADFSEVVKQKYIMARNGAYQTIFTAVFPMLISVIFYAMAGGFLDENLPLPIFLAFMAAFQSFQGGLLGVASGFWSLLAIKPEFDRIMPILSEESEDCAERHNPGKLDGKVAVAHANFRYNPQEPLVLQDVSFEANPGEFVAIVGPSGAGKSSLLRLLLGFEQPETGAVYYSGRDLGNLNLRAIRRQLGVILQNSKILPGSILENVITGTDCTVAQAWHALELAAFAAEVRAMPMGIHTLVTPETISGGQQQRILIARALIGEPAVIIMDESTSALDNLAQETVKENLEKLHTTRIVIAHRLSTIIRADRIYVMAAGRVVQHGTFQELMAQEGLFKQLAARQLTDQPESLS